jgi:putative transposase
MASRAQHLIPTEDEAWFTASELEDLGLPGLPGDKRSINRRADAERWASRLGPDNRLLVRKRTGRGGGVEFHASLLPGEARIELARRGLIRTRPQEAGGSIATAWGWFDSQKASVKAKAQRKLDVVNTVQLLCEAGSTTTAAVAAASDQHGVGRSTIYTWLGAVEGIPRTDWLVALADRHKGGGAEAEIHPDLWSAFASDYLRPSAPTLTSCYRRVVRMAQAKCIPVPSERTFRRRLEREYPAAVLTLKREGEEALRRSIPAQRRSVAELRALECVNIDGHKFDVFVKLPDGRVIRPIMVTIQDIYSRKMLAWRLGGEESAIQTRLTFADLFRNFGIPASCVLDNGRAFASKWISGGAKTRFRFKVRPEDPTGLLTSLGIKIHWALPYRGQSKPIERGFRDLCDSIAKHPACDGAYTGNSPLAKPENYGSKAVEWDRFVALVDEEIAAHNAQTGRRTEIAAGRSFDDVFFESYAASAIGKATPEQLRMALLAADQKLINRQTGEIELHGNRYWHPELSSRRGDRVTVRFDPDALHSEVHVYDLEGRYITAADLIADTGFHDAAGAKEAAKRHADFKKATKAQANAAALLSPDQLADLQAGVAPAPTPRAGAVRPVRVAGTAIGGPRSASPESPGCSEPTPLSALERMRIGRAKLAASNN